MAPAPHFLLGRDTLPYSPENGHLVQTRAGYNAVSVVCLLAGITMATIRLRQFRKAGIIDPSRVLALGAYVSVVIYLVVMNMFSGGVGMQDIGVCSALIYVCLCELDSGRRDDIVIHLLTPHSFLWAYQVVTIVCLHVRDEVFSLLIIQRLHG